MICKHCKTQIPSRYLNAPSFVCPGCGHKYVKKSGTTPNRSQTVAPNRAKKKASSISKKKLLYIALVILLVIVMIGVISSLTGKKPANDVGKVETVEAVNASTPEPDFVGVISQAIQGAVGEGEAITDVSLTNRDLCVVVDMSNADPAPFTIEELAVNRMGSITDEILNYKEYDALWDTITIDFGNIGKVVSKKEDIEENEYGMRYFPSAGWYELFNLV